MNLEHPLPQGRAVRDAKCLSRSESKRGTSVQTQKPLSETHLVVCTRCSWLPSSIKIVCFLQLSCLHCNSFAVFASHNTFAHSFDMAGDLANASAVQGVSNICVDAHDAASVSRVLPIFPRFAGLIVDGLKVWELRIKPLKCTNNTRIGIAVAGSPDLIGTAYVAKRAPGPLRGSH